MLLVLAKVLLSTYNICFCREIQKTKKKKKKKKKKNFNSFVETRKMPNGIIDFFPLKNKDNISL